MRREASSSARGLLLLPLVGWEERVVEGAVLARVWEMPDVVRSEVDSPWSMGIADGAMAGDVLCGLVYDRDVSILSV